MLSKLSKTPNGLTGPATTFRILKVAIWIAVHISVRQKLLLPD